MIKWINSLLFTVITVVGTCQYFDITKQEMDIVFNVIMLALMFKLVFKE